MSRLELVATNKEQEGIKNYLEGKASDELAFKINNGVKVEKDGKTLINRKDLTGFMTYASGEAKKLAEQGKSYCCVADEVVFGWAIHYFEEDSIIGKLYNEDGTEYVPESKNVKAVKTQPKLVKEEKAKEPSLFDFFNEQESPANEVTQTQEKKESDNSSCQSYNQYLELKKKYPEHIIAIKVGDFYEMYEDDAKTVANETTLTLTSKSVGNDKRVALVGFPAHLIDVYSEKLQKKYKLAIVNSLSDYVVKEQKDEYIDYETGEILTEEEMREFDGDIEEPDDIDYEDIEEEQEDDVLSRLKALLGDDIVVR